MDRNKLLKMAVVLACIVVIMGSISRLLHKDSLTLTDYAKLHPTPLPEESSAADESEDADLPSSQEPDSSLPQNSPEPAEEDLLTGAALNGSSMLEQRVSLTEDFYYEPLSDRLRRYITGISYPDINGGADSSGPGSGSTDSSGSGSGEDSSGPDDGSADSPGPDDGTDSSGPEIGLEELRYVHILHIDYEGNTRSGELICNEYIAQDLTEIFYELYRSEYRLESVLLIDEYDGDDNASMEANNTSCFNYRPITENAGLSMHAYGLAVDINPLYNPYIAYLKDGSMEVLPASAQPYADRQQSFPYKIDENDFCYKLFTRHGFIWGGNWNNIKDYQHFQKPMP